MEHMAFPRIPERFLRYVWQRQIFASSPLRTPDGARIVVRFPGSLNPDGGPDFTGASIRIGHVLYRGDVELHIRASSWRAHGHSADPHYNRVILHVVLLPGRTARPPRTASGRVVPLLVLSPFVDPLLYGRWVNTFRNETVSPVQCRRRKGVLPPDQLNRRLRMLGRRRIEARVRALGNRLNWLIGESRAGSGDTGGNADAIRRAAWEQLLYECLLEGMGYAGNRLPFLALARSVSLLLLKSHGPGDARTMQALLFGAAGLLPPLRTLRDRESRAYVRALRRKWRVLRPGLRVPLLHEGDWMFFRRHPVNFPTARLAAFCFLLPSLFTGRPLSRLHRIVGEQGATPLARRSAIESLFKVSPDRFWSRHIHFGGAGKNGGIALGRARVHELIVNGIVPLLLLHARVFHDSALQRESLTLLRALPAQGENGVTRLVKAALRGVKGGKTGLRGPVEQQGLLHLYGTYCSRGKCSRCPVRTGLRRGKSPKPADAARGVRMSRRWSPARMSSCSRR
jgi:hypothetical protein